MLKTCHSLLADETGFLITSELVLIATLGVIGLTAGLACVRDAVSAELVDVSDAFSSLNQSYCYTGFSAASSQCCKSSTPGSCFTDHCEDNAVQTEVHGGTIIRPATQQLSPEPTVDPIPSAPCPAEVVPSEAPCETPSAAAPSVPHAVATNVAPCNACNSGATASVAQAHVVSAAPCSKCGPQPRPVHTVYDECGRLQHYSETRGEIVRLIDEVDAIHLPAVTPTLPLW